MLLITLEYPPYQYQRNTQVDSILAKFYTLWSESKQELESGDWYVK